MLELPFGSFEPLVDYDLVQSPRDRNEQFRYLLMRAAFLCQLSNDDKVKLLFNKWAGETGSRKKAEKIYSVAMKLASICGFEDPGEFSAALFAGTDELHPKDIVRANEFVKEGTRFFRLWKEFVVCWLRSQRKVHTRVLALVRDEFRLRSPWLCLELEATFNCKLLELAFGLEFWTVYEQAPNTAPKLSFHTLKGESLDDAKKRFKELGKLLNAQQSTNKGSRRPKNEGEHLVRYVEWYYRHKIRKEKIYAIAKDYCQQNCNGIYHPTTDHRSKIQNGIKKAGAILKLTPLPK